MKKLTSQQVLDNYGLNTWCECGDGWSELLDNLCQDLVQAGWNKKLDQCKEKFGGLRFYISDYEYRPLTANEKEYNKLNIIITKLNSIIEKYEDLSYTICDNCGDTKVKNICNGCKELNGKL